MRHGSASVGLGFKAGLHFNGGVRFGVGLGLGPSRLLVPNPQQGSGFLKGLC